MNISIKKTLNGLINSGYNIQSSENDKSVKLTSIDDERLYFEIGKPLRNIDKLSLISFIRGIKLGIKLQKERVRNKCEQELAENYIEVIEDYYDEPKIKE